VITNNTVSNNGDCGIRLYSSFDNIIAENSLYDNLYGIYLFYGGNNIILKNNASINVQVGVVVLSSNLNTLENNVIMFNSEGIWLSSENCTVVNNIISGNAYGVVTPSSINNMIYHNSFINNTNQADDTENNSWDSGYPSGGNYWSDYTGSDVFSGSNQDIPGSDGIGDLPYNSTTGQGILGGAGNQDNYPLMEPGGTEKPVAVAKPDYQEANVYDNVTLYGNLSYDLDGSVVSYFWDFGDGSTDWGMFVTHWYDSPGNYTVILTVTDNDGLVDTDTCIVRIFGTQSPVANADPDYQQILLGELPWDNATFDASLSYDPDGTIISYQWDFGDGYGYTGTENTTTHQYTVTGNYTVTLTVTDNDGFTDTDTCIVNVTGIQVPVAVAEPDYQEVNIDEIVSFFGNLSYDPDGTIIDYFWEFGDGANDTGISSAHIYTTSGNYTVTLTVTDNDGLTDTDTCVVRVVGLQSPVAVAEPDFQEIMVGEAAEFYGNQSYDPDGTIISYYWDFGDGYTGMGINSTHIYTNSGSYVVTLTVTDNDGLTNSDTCIVIVTGLQSPVAIAEPPHQEVSIGENASFHGNLSYDPDGTIVDYFWDFGDGQNGTEIFVQHAYAISGNYTVTLTVTDNDGLTDTDICTVYIVGLEPPVAIAMPDYQGIFVGEEAYFYGNLSYDPDGTIVSYFWDFGDGHTGTGINQTHVYTVSGYYTVTLTVTDNDGLTGTDTCFVNVTGLQSPVAVAEPSYQEWQIGEAAIFNGNFSYDPDGSIVQHHWDFGDGQTATGPIQAHIYAAPGNFMVTLTVIDNDGLTDTDTSTVIIVDTQPPIILDVVVAPSEPTNRAKITILCWVEDNVNVESVTMTYLHNGTDWVTLSMANDVSQVYHVVFGPESQNFTFYINVTDSSGNVATYSDDVVVRTVKVETSGDAPDPEQIEEGSQIHITGTVYVDGVLNGTGFSIVILIDGEILDSCVVQEDGSYSLDFILPSRNSADSVLEIQLLDTISGEMLPISSYVIPGEQPFPWLLFMFGSIIGASAALGLATEVGKFGLLLVLLPLYTKLKKDEVLDTYTRGKIHGYIMANPGEHYNAIKRALGMNNGSLAYHLNVLEKEELVKSKTNGIYKRFYPKDMIIPNGGQIHLTEAQKLILKNIEETPGISQKDIAALLGVSASTINYHITKLVEMNAVRTERKGIGVRYYKTPMSVDHFVSVNSAPAPALAPPVTEEPPVRPVEECPGCEMIIEPDMKKCPFCNTALEPEDPEAQKKREFLERLEKAHEEGRISESAYLKNRKKFGS